MKIEDFLKLARVWSIKPSEAEGLIAYVMSRSRSFVIAHAEEELTKSEEHDLRKLFTRRATGEPLAYLLGTQGFYGREFLVTPETLIPRADTEILVETALAILRKLDESTQPDMQVRKTNIIDIGTGSGNIIISVATEFTQNYNFYATDIDPNALEIAQKNAKRHNVAAQITFVAGDLLTPLLNTEACNLRKAPLLILANLPYVDLAHKETLLSKPQSCELAFEPASALWAPQNGLALYDQLFAQIAQILSGKTTTDFAQNQTNNQITILCEIDPSQETSLITLARTHFPHHNLTTITHHDLAERPRTIQIDIT